MLVRASGSSRSASTSERHRKVTTLAALAFVLGCIVAAWRDPCVLSLPCHATDGCSYSSRWGVEAPTPTGYPPRSTEACARLTGCVDFRGEFSAPGGFTSCVTIMGDPALDPVSLTECAVTAVDCTAAATCLNAGEDPLPCDPATFERGCAGDVARTCRGGVIVGRDCAEVGLSCVENVSGDVFCGRPEPCDVSTCEGDTLLLCVAGAVLPQECGDAVCRVEPNLRRSAECVSDEPCEGPAVYECDGDVAVTCPSGYVHRELCGPGLCSSVDGAFCMRDPACAELPRCDGTELVHCVGGVPSRVDCTSLGLSACVESAGAVLSEPAEHEHRRRADEPSAALHQQAAVVRRERLSGRGCGGARRWRRGRCARACPGEGSSRWRRSWRGRGRAWGRSRACRRRG